MFVRGRLFRAATLLWVGMFWLGGSSEAAERAWDAFPVSDLVRVFEDGYAAPTERPSEICVGGLGNETVSAQFVIQAHTEVKDLTVAVSPLKAVAGSAVIPADNVHWNFVGSIFIAENTRKQLASDLLRAAPAWFPDYLAEDRQCSVAGGGWKAVYLTVSIPRDAEPGEYRAEVTVAAGDASVVLPLRLTVSPLVLPDDRHLLVTEWYSTSRFKQHHGIESADSEPFWEMLRVYAQNMAEHRQNVFQVSMELIAASRNADGKLRFDFSQFDRWADVFWATGRMDRLETGFVARFGEGGWSSREVVLRDFSVRDEAAGKTIRMPGAEFLPVFLPALVEHLREKGWLDKTLFHIADEPSNHNLLPWREASDFVHRHASELRRMDAIETPHCTDRLEVWCPKLDHLAAWQEAYEDAQRQGNEMWFYTVGIFQGGAVPNKTVDVPLIESRVMHWLNYRYSLRGYLHWGYNAWTDDPVNEPGKHRGDGWHVYPKKDGLLNSLRWEQMRNGIQDYECLWLLEDKISQIRATLSPRVAELIQPQRRSVEIASQVVRTYSDYTRDPAVLYAARQQVIQEAIELDKPPRVIFQTNPPEHTAVAGDWAVDVHGWAEPGTQIKVNGQAATVEADGLFLIQTSPSRKGTLTLEAAGEQGRKTLVRRFQILPDRHAAAAAPAP